MYQEKLIKWLSGKVSRDIYILPKNQIKIEWQKRNSHERKSKN